ncbi:FCD domain-containing protein [Streptomyces sp. NBC_00825]|uniref:FadR/GntR family transcriptional regulator n=1 Tax=unclassified Streptomyces TaxID=2593676 RepID=UPI002259C369|nr:MULTISPECIES: FCD domain-containing protein [unclassified Streptomyces]WTB51829.1 FCD domain-containing protein [Streptomyces sp. NBC_00826]WTH95278.1 FCD domain-containing protein [Streptomyces sp. NBC_00825]WTI04012.1 FCD domain-containing protein [Streptomyces sp. NBC_00822]MCX4869605.1 FCD domain-containing protein [Streptomyces sp. NBC_00906]MCX4900844.1 FCD domain-containing protein [Streptomyces sp. NBC_00892]
MTPYARRGVHGQTVETLARRVLSGEIPEGATLDLVALQDELDVSLTALRESLKVLAAKGMVDARQKRGTFVRARADWNLLDADVLRWQFAGGTGSGTDPALLYDLGEVRGIIEPAAVRLAAARRTDSDLDALEAALAAMGEQEGGAAHAVEADLAFHRALLAATHNELLERMEMVIESGLAHRDEIVHSSPHGEDPVPSHRAVLDAVRDQDQAAAERAMRDLLDQAVRDLDRAHGTRPAIDEGTSSR